MKKECSVDGCSREVFGDTTECALHCEKHSYAEDKESGLLKAFYDELIEYIAYNAYSRGVIADNKMHLSPMHIRKIVLESGSLGTIKAITILFDKIYFPARSSDDEFDYCKIIKEFNNADFEECEFVASKLEFVKDKFGTYGTEVFFKKCIFNQIWEIDLPEIYGGKRDTFYEECTFKEYVSVCSSIPKRSLICSPFGNKCFFYKNLVFKDINLAVFDFSTMFHPSFKNTNLMIMDCTIEEDFVLEDREINSLLIENSEFKEKFVLNRLKTNKLVIKDTEFEGKVELGDGNIGEAELNNTNFKGLFHSHNTKYGKFLCYKSIFKDFAGFEDGIFGDSQSKAPSEQMAKFEYVTFESFTNFRSTKFNLGLDLERTNFKEYPNFLDIEIKSNNTNRETFRILKYSFDKIGNHIEANKFFAREMAKYKQELSGKGLTQERFVFWFNSFFSNFGQSYIRPIVGIVGFAIVYYLLTLGHKNNLLYSFSPCTNKAISWVSCVFNGFAKSIIPFKQFFREGMEFVSLFFYIIFATLIWLTIVAVKRHTRR